MFFSVLKVKSTKILTPIFSNSFTVSLVGKLPNNPISFIKYDVLSICYIYKILFLISFLK